MLKFIALSLLVVSCSGAPAQEDASEVGIANRYRQEVESLLGFRIPPLKCVLYDEKKVKFYLYTNQVPDKVELKADDFQYLVNSSYDVSRDTKVILHDWLFSVNYTQEIKTAYLRHSTKPVNVISIDYSYYSQCQATDIMHPRIYQNIAKTLARLLSQAVRRGSSPHMMHLIGFGIGAHIAGAAAKELRPMQVARITGLDPVGFKFDTDKSLPQLEENDADFVDIISTNAGRVGSTQSRGAAQFFPHGGVSQYETAGRSGMAESHVKSLFYFVESIVRGKVFKSRVSNSWADFKLGRYNPDLVSYMGEYASKNVTGDLLTGDLFLEVNRLPPYGEEEDKHTREQQIASEKESYPHTYLSLIDTKSKSYQQGQNQQVFSAPKQYRNSGAL